MADKADEIIADVEASATKAFELKPESELHVQGITLRLYRLEALLIRASKYVPRYDDDGHLLPLKQVIDTELGVKT